MKRIFLSFLLTLLMALPATAEVITRSEIQFTDPNQDTLFGWDDSADDIVPIMLGTGLSITGTTINASGSELPAYTAGSILFGNGTSIPAQDNAGLFWDDTNNRLGVNTATPGATLEVVTSGFGEARFRNTTSSSYTSFRFLNDRNSDFFSTIFGMTGSTSTGMWSSGTSGEQGFLGTTTTHPLTFATNGLQRAIITGGGLVGIGVTGNSTPLVSKFTVSGSTALGNYPFQTAPTNGLIVTGNTGIGTPYPISRLHSDGNVLVTDSTVAGSEKVTNGTFTGSSTNWTETAPWAYGTNNEVKGSDGTGTLSQNVGAVAGEYYLVSFVISNWTVGTVTVSVGGASGTAVGVNGTFNYILKATTTGNLIFTPTNTSRFTLDTVSVKKITGGDLVVLGSTSLGNNGFVVSNAGTVTSGVWNGTVLGLTYGGTGLPNTRTSIATSGTITDMPVASAFLVMTSGASPNIRSMVAQADGTEVTIYNADFSSIVTIEHNNGATAANRFELPGSANYEILGRQAATFRYYGTISRWVKLDGYGYASGSTAGILSAAQYVTLNAKPSGSGSTNAVSYWSSPADITADSDFGFNPTSVRLGVGVTVDDQEATGHFKSDVATTIANPSGFSVTQTLWNPIATPSSSSASVTTPNMPRTTGTLASINYSGSGYTANGQTIDYIIIPAYDSGAGLTYGVAQSASFTAGADDNSSNPYSIDLSWSPDSGLATPNTWVILRQINGGGFNDAVTVLTTSYSDDNSAWTTIPSLTPTYPDFLANGSNNISFSAYGKGLTPAATIVYSPTADSYMFTDPNDGSAFLILHSGSSSTEVRVVNGTNTDHFEAGPGSPWSFTQTTANLTAGQVVTPNTYGYLSNGSNLNISYDLYSYDTANIIYSSGSSNQTTTDPNDGLYYYNVLQPTTPDGGKIIKDSSTGLFVTTAGTYYDDGITTFPDGTTVTPTSVYAPAGLWESHGSSLSDKAGMISRSLDGTYSRLEFQDNTGARKGYFEQDTSNLTFQGGGGAYLQLHNSTNVMYGSAVTSIQFDSASLVLNANSGGGGALAYTGVNRLTWGDLGLRVNGVSTGYNSGFEVQSYDASHVALSVKQSSAGNTQSIQQWLNSSNAIVASVSAAGSALFSGLSLIDATNIAFGTSTGTKIGTSTSQKIGFYNSTPIVQPSGSIKTALQNLGLVASPTITLSSDVTGTLPITNGGFGRNTIGLANQIPQVNAAANGFDYNYAMNQSVQTVDKPTFAGLISTAPMRLKNYTVATLPTCNGGAQGDMAYVTDSLAPVYLTTIAGGGSAVAPVFCDGSNWVAH